MTHDPLCPEPECVRSCVPVCDGDDASHYCQCDLIAEVRADERERCGRQLLTALPDGGTQAGLVWHGSKTDEWTMRETR